SIVIPAQAGTQRLELQMAVCSQQQNGWSRRWIPACAGMTNLRDLTRSALAPFSHPDDYLSIRHTALRHALLTRQA
ncbi:MAG TPA: hypothetical protein VLF15_10660, partial [Pseudoxanthomonas sp.]|nr:hypothetical protein [Pseudoxanthomonas sp.]